MQDELRYYQNKLDRRSHDRSSLSQSAHDMLIGKKRQDGSKSALNLSQIRMDRKITAMQKAIMKQEMSYNGLQDKIKKSKWPKAILSSLNTLKDSKQSLEFLAIVKL